VAGVDAVIAPVALVAAPTIAESDVGNSPTPNRDPAADTVYPADQLSRLAVAFDPAGFTRGAFRLGCN
jgi:aspartyl-tRNA(Asn)/glutamyl-tRNA(Gln) amidotransferase subunit A